MNNGSFIALAKLQHLRVLEFRSLLHIRNNAAISINNPSESELYRMLKTWLALCYKHLPSLFIAGYYFEGFNDGFNGLDYYKHTAVQVEAGRVLQLRQFAVIPGHSLPPNGTLPQLQSLILLIPTFDLGLITRHSFTNLRELIMKVGINAALTILNELGQQLLRLQLRVRGNSTLDVCEVIRLCPTLIKCKLECFHLAPEYLVVALPDKSFQHLKVFELTVNDFHQMLPTQLVQQLIQAPQLQNLYMEEVWLDTLSGVFLVNVVQTGHYLANLKEFNWHQGTYYIGMLTMMLMVAVGIFYPKPWMPLFAGND